MVEHNAPKVGKACNVLSLPTPPLTLRRQHATVFHIMWHKTNQLNHSMYERRESRTHRSRSLVLTVRCFSTSTPWIVGTVPVRLIHGEL